MAPLTAAPTLPPTIRLWGVCVTFFGFFVSPHGAVLNYKQKYRTKQVGYAALPW